MNLTAPAHTGVSIADQDLAIPGILTLPAASDGARHPAVVLLHGTASHKDEVGDLYVRLANGLGDRGIASLRIDMPGAGESGLPETAYTYAAQVRSTKAALSWLEGHDRIDRDRLAILGFSQGGRVVATVAGTDERVRALGAWAPWTLTGERIVELDVFRDAYATAQHAGHAPVDLGHTTWEFSHEWFETIRASDPLRDVANYHGPLLAVVGSDDQLTNPQEARDLVYHARSSDVTLRVGSGADHIFNVLGADQSDAEFVLGLTADWFAQRLGG